MSSIESRVLPVVTILPFDLEVARVYGRVAAELEAAGRKLHEADLQIGATALYHGLALVTGNIRHFSRIVGLQIEPVLANARRTAE
jgi:predicted nucleic acid-binding protein